MLSNRTFFRLYGPYLRRPALWPEIWRREFEQPLARHLGLAEPSYANAEEKAHLKADAAAWCATVALDCSQALASLGAPEFSEAQLEEAFPDVFAYARAQVTECPVKLGGPGNLALLFALSEHLGATRVVETGVAYGWSSLIVLLSLRSRPQGCLYSVDLPYFQLRNDPWVGCVVPPELRRQWRLYRMADREGLPRALGTAGTIDLAHYDSDKSPTGRAWAYPRLWRALRPGGLLLSDDVSDNFTFREFSERVGIEPIIIRDADKVQGILAKPNAKASEGVSTGSRTSEGG